MSRRKKHQEESYENAEGFQIEDIHGNAVAEDALPEDEDNGFWADDDDDEEHEEDDFFSSVAEENNWEEGYDY